MYDKQLSVNRNEACAFCHMPETGLRGPVSELNRTTGAFTSLKAVVHFYNTRDTLPRCQTHDPGEGRTCWPAPETTQNMNASHVGRLGLTDPEEDAIVSFMQTLSDGYTPRGRP